MPSEIDYSLPTHAPTGPGLYRLRNGSEVNIERIENAPQRGFSWQMSGVEEPTHSHWKWAASGSWFSSGEELDQRDIIAPVSSDPVAARGTHVRFQTTKGSEMVGPISSMQLYRNENNCSVSFIGEVLSEGQVQLYSITPQEYSRLAALLTGEALTDGRE